MLYTTKVKHPDLQAVTHVDGTCRIHTVSKNNSVFRNLLEEFNKITKHPLLLNTSLNLAGKPIAGYPENAIDLLYQSDIDMVFVGNEVYTR